MRAAAQWEALEDIFAGRCDAVMAGAVLSSKISITSKILALYEEKLGKNQGFQTWFASASQGRISLHLPSLSPKKVADADLNTNGYGTAAYFGSSNFFSNKKNLSQLEISSLNSIGIRIIPITQRITFSIDGDNPVLTIGTDSGGELDFNILDRFLAPEEHVVIYDKYINNCSIELLEHIAKNLGSGAKLFIFHTFQNGRNLLDSAEILSRLSTANPNIEIICTKCSTKFKKLEHDRYVFLGQRFQIVFTAGLDCFGLVDNVTRKRLNRKSKINFYDVTNGVDLEIEDENGGIKIVKSFSGVN